MISRRLRLAIKNSGPRQYDYAHVIKVHPSTLSGWLNGISRVRHGDPRIVQLGAMCGVPARACFASRVRPAKPRREEVTTNVLGRRNRPPRISHVRHRS